MQRVAIVGDGPAALSTAERLIGAGMCVDLVCAKPAPFGLLRHFAGLAGVRHEAAAFYLSSWLPAAWPLPLGKGYTGPPSNPKTGPPSPAARNLRQSAFSRLLA